MTEGVEVYGICVTFCETCSVFQVGKEVQLKHCHDVPCPQKKFTASSTLPRSVFLVGCKKRAGYATPFNVPGRLLRGRVIVGRHNGYCWFAGPPSYWRTSSLVTSLWYRFSSCGYYNFNTLSMKHEGMHMVNNQSTLALH